MQGHFTENAVVQILPPQTHNCGVKTWTGVWLLKGLIYESASTPLMIRLY